MIKKGFDEEDNQKNLGNNYQKIKEYVPDELKYIHRIESILHIHKFDKILL